MYTESTHVPSEIFQMTPLYKFESTKILFNNLCFDFTNFTEKSVAVGDFLTRGCFQKSTLHFLKFYFNLRFFNFFFFCCKFYRIFFKINIRFLKNIFWDLRPKRILLCVNEGRSQKLNLVT